MPYVMVDDFQAGIDRRKSALTAPPGSLRQLRNAIVTSGGEIEKAQVFASLGALPPGETQGLAFDGTNLVVFGLAAAPTGALPNYVTYQQLTPSVSGLTLLRVLDVERFTSLLYVVAETSDNVIRHFYNGAEVPAAEVVGNSITAHKQKLYATDGENLRFSAIRDATDWTTGVGNGIIDVTQEASDGARLVGVEPYYNFLALFARTHVQIWGMDPDPAANALQQTLSNIGLVGRHAVARYGTGDVLFLSDTGIRSLRARDSSNAASVNDVGSPVDALTLARRATLTAQEAAKITALVDPLSGRFWLIWGREIFVLSTYPNARISAWSLLDTGTPVDAAITANSRIVTRIGDEIFLYGLPPAVSENPFDPNVALNVSASSYDASEVLVETPFFDAAEPATSKRWTGIDVTCEGTWQIEVNPDPISDIETWVSVGRVTQATWGLGRVPIDFQTHHLAVRLRSTNNGFARLSNMALHFETGEAS